LFITGNVRACQELPQGQVAIILTKAHSRGMGALNKVLHVEALSLGSNPYPLIYQFLPKWHPFHISERKLYSLLYLKDSENSRVSYDRHIFPWAFSCPGSVTTMPFRPCPTSSGQLLTVPRCYFCQILVPFYFFNFSCHLLLCSVFWSPFSALRFRVPEAYKRHPFWAEPSRIA